MNSTEDIGMGSTSPRAMDSAFSALAITAQALNASTSSAFETASGGVNRAVEAMTAWRDGCTVPAPSRPAAAQDATANTAWYVILGASSHDSIGVSSLATVDGRVGYRIFFWFVVVGVAGFGVNKKDLGSG